LLRSNSVVVSKRLAICSHDRSLSQFQEAHREWVEAGSSGDIARRDDRWSESIAVGSEGFVEQVKIELAFRPHHRQVSMDGLFTLREPVLLMATIPIGKLTLYQITLFAGRQTAKQQKVSLVPTQRH
jgi:hypothetical protein